MRTQLLVASALSLAFAAPLLSHDHATDTEMEATSSQTPKVDYPSGYRDWTHVKSMILLENHPISDIFGGLHHIYANEIALKAMRNGSSYPDGAVFVFDLMETSTDEGETATVEGPRIRLDVMQKNAELWQETGGWGYETFDGDSQDRVLADPIASCHSCHTSMEESDFVFSKFRK